MDRLSDADWLWNHGLDGVLGALIGGLLAAAVTIIAVRITLKRERQLAEEAADQQRQLAQEAADQQRQLAEEAADQQRIRSEEAMKQQIELLLSSVEKQRESTEIAAARETAARLQSVALTTAGQVRKEHAKSDLVTLATHVQGLLFELAARTSQRWPHLAKWAIRTAGDLSRTAGAGPEEFLDCLGTVVNRGNAWMRRPDNEDAKCAQEERAGIPTPPGEPEQPARQE